MGVIAVWFRMLKTEIVRDDLLSDLLVRVRSNTLSFHTVRVERVKCIRVKVVISPVGYLVLVTLHG